MTNSIRPGVLSILCLLLLIGCAKINKITDEITKPSAREIYKRDFSKDPRYAAWQAAYKNVVSDSVEISLPYAEKGKFTPSRQHAYNYFVSLKQGELLVAQVITDSLNKQVFFDVFEVTNGSMQHFDSAKSPAMIESQIKNTGLYKIVIQPEIDFDSGFTILINKKPQFGFPVAGKGNSAIESFMGMPRDNGTRVHEGIDIFAAKGTPVVAATDGVITDTGDRGLGGKQVWQRAGLFGSAIYYAHLDEIAITVGKRVKAGDTLGFVGNTGNAKGGRPHLHFGIYGAGGAVDPLPFVFRPIQVTTADFKLTYENVMMTVKKSAVLRQRPDSKSNKLGELQKPDPLIVLGQHKEWLHIRTGSGKAAFIHKDLVMESPKTKQGSHGAF